jgi:predicted DNA binding CopG/RHH family protein
MKKNIRENEEKEILEAYESGEWQTSQNAKSEANKLSHYAINTLKKDKRISFRMSSKDLNQVRVIAAQEGIPYQTLISSVIHKYVAGSLVEKRRG